MHLKPCFVYLSSLLLLLACTNTKNDTHSEKRDRQKEENLRAIYVRSTHKWGFVDTSGKLVIAGKYDQTFDFSDGLGRIWHNRRRYYINAKEEIFFDDDTTVNGLKDFSEGLAWICKTIPGGKYPKDAKYGLMNKKGQMITGLLYGWAEDFKEGLSVAQRDDSSFFIDTNGKEIYATRDTVWGPFSNGLVRIYKNGKFGFLDRKGRLVIPCVYQKADAFSEGFANVDRPNRNGYSGFIDTLGNAVIPVIYDDTAPFRSARARVKKDGKYGFINKQGEPVIPIEYDHAFSFSERWTFVTVDEHHYIIDTSGAIIREIPATYQDIDYRLCDGNIEARAGGKQIYILKDGREVVIP